MERRVVVTGMGMVSPLGTSVEESWTGLVAGESGVDVISLFDASTYETRIAAEVKHFSIEDYIDDRRLIARMAERRTQFGVAAARMAVEDSKIELNGVRTCVTTGAGLGIVRLEDICRWLDKNDGFKLETFAQELEEIHPESLIRNEPALVSELIAQLYHIPGSVYTFTSACAASTQAIGHAMKMIQRDEADVIIAGGSDSMINPMGVTGFVLLGNLSTENESPEKASKPFDRKRDGVVIGEGAAMVILEELNHALNRGGKIYAEVIGYGTSLDAYRLTAPHNRGVGAELAMKNALKDAKINPFDVQYINAHGTSTTLNDKIETLAIKKVFGQHAYQLALSSNKSMVGHLIAACGALEFIFTVLTVVRDTIPPTINYRNKDPHCDLDYVPNVSRKKEVHTALTNSFGFGGHNATLAIQKYLEGAS